MTDVEPSPGPAQLVVLGMHRSGTSGVTRLLNLAGAHFGPEGIATEANEENPRGFWERRDVRAVCDGLLHGAGFDWWKLVGFDAVALPPEVVAEGRAAFATVLEELDAHRPWVVKEPRLCVLLPVLAPLLDAPVCVHVTREPLEVARSMHQRDGFPLQAALGLWELYTVRAVEASAGMPRLLVRYEDLMADPVGTTTRLVDDLAALGVAGLHHVDPDEVLGFISADLHRQRQDPARRRERLNASQAVLAARVDDGSLLTGPAPLPVSEGALDALADLERERDLAARLRQAELDLASQERRAAEAARRAELDLASLERRFGNERHRFELDLASRDRQLERAEKRIEEETRYKEVELARRRALGRQAEDALATLARQLERFDRSRVGRVATNLVSLRQTVTPGVARTTAGPLTHPLAELAARRAEIAAYARQEPAPGGTSEGLFPTDDPLVWRTRPKVRPSEPARPSMAVISWDVGHNPLGRANVLAEVLARRFDVELWGAQFERYGSDVWAPLRRAATPINLFPGHELPAHLRTMDRVAGLVEADLVWVSKPRLPSYLLGLDAKLARNRPLVLDVDDHELAFFAEDTALGIDDLLGQRGRDDLRWPFERDWTRLCDSYIDAADLVTVSNVALQDRYGGLIVPHARDERRFDPARFDREATRDRLGVRPHERLLLFGGTPRAHKGVVEVLEALERLGDDRYRVLMFGTKEFDELKGRIGDLARWARVLPAQPFDDLPELVNAADLACVIQDPSHPVSRYQMPAKVSDALAMGVPCLVSRTPPLGPLVDAGVLQVLEPGDELHERIARVFDDPDDARSRADRGRELFLREYSYEAVADRLAPVFDGLLENTPPVSERQRELAEAPGLIWKAAYDGPTRAPRPESPSPSAKPAGPSAPKRPAARRPRHLDPDAAAVEPGATFDVVMFWKQNDSGIYGRRQDMVLQELARSPRVGTIVHFDNPISPEALLESYRAGRRQAADQRRLVATESVARVLRRRDEPGVHRHTFVFGGHYTRRLGRPHRGAYISHVRSVLAGHGVGTGRRPVVVWAYPSNDDLPGLIDALAPALVVADVVDDNRTWYQPGEPHYERVERNYEAVLARSDVVLANCEPVAESMARFAAGVHVVPNGLELPGARPAGPPPAAVAALGRPLLAYVGNLSDRIDLELLEALARARPSWNLALVGSAHRDPAALALGRLPNVHVLGVLPYQQVRGFLAHVDVALIPHVDNEMTRSMNPLKAFVYASAGVPVVSTPVANLPDFGGLITVAEGVDGFLEAIEAHLAAGRPEVDLELLRPHSWQQRVAQVFEIVDEVLAVPPPAAPEDAEA